MTTVKIGKGSNPKEYTVKELDPQPGIVKGLPIAIILGDCKDMYPTRKNPKVQGLTKMENKAKYTPEDSVGMAASDEPEKRPALCHVHIDNGTMVSADGFRLHTAPTTKKTCPICEKDGLKFPDYKQIIPTRHAYAAQVDSSAMYQAVIRAGVFAREGNNTIVIRANGHFEVTGKDVDYGRAQTDIEYESITGVMADMGGDLTFGINWKFARDAIKHVAPNGGIITIKAQAPTAPVVFEANDRMAVVMPMQLPK